jgi:hypothetical protein
VIAISPGSKLLLPDQPFMPINILGLGKRFECEGCTVWCSLISSIFKGLDKYWWLNQITYAGEFLAWKRFLQRA